MLCVPISFSFSTQFLAPFLFFPPFHQESGSLKYGNGTRVLLGPVRQSVLTTDCQLWQLHPLGDFLLLFFLFVAVALGVFLLDVFVAVVRRLSRHGVTRMGKLTRSLPLVLSEQGAAKVILKQDEMCVCTDGDRQKERCRRQKGCLQERQSVGGANVASRMCPESVCVCVSSSWDALSYIFTLCH